MKSLLRILTCSSGDSKSKRGSGSSGTQSLPTVTAASRKELHSSNRRNTKFRRSRSLKDSQHEHTPQRHSHIFSHILHHRSASDSDQSKRNNHDNTDLDAEYETPQPWRPGYEDSNTEPDGSRSVFEQEIRAKNRTKSVGGYISNLNIPLVTVSSTSLGHHLSHSSTRECRDEKDELVENLDTAPANPQASHSPELTGSPEATHFSSPEAFDTPGTVHSSPSFTPIYDSGKAPVPLSQLSKESDTDYEDIDDEDDDNDNISVPKTPIRSMHGSPSLKRQQILSSKGSHRTKSLRFLSEHRHNSLKPPNSPIALPSPYARSPASSAGSPATKHRHRHLHRHLHHYTCSAKPRTFMETQLRSRAGSRKGSFSYPNPAAPTTARVYGKEPSSQPSSNSSKSLISSASHLFESVRNSTCKIPYGDSKPARRERSQEKVSLGDAEAADTIPMMHARGSQFLITDEDVHVDWPAADDDSWDDQASTLNSEKDEETVSEEENAEESSSFSVPSVQPTPNTSLQDARKPSRRGRFSFPSRSRRSDEFGEHAGGDEQYLAPRSKYVGEQGSGSQRTAGKALAGISSLTAATAGAVAAPIIKRAVSTKRDIASALGREPKGDSKGELKSDPKGESKSQQPAGITPKHSTTKHPAFPDPANHSLPERPATMPRGPGNVVRQEGGQRQRAKTVCAPSGRATAQSIQKSSRRSLDAGLNANVDAKVDAKVDANVDANVDAKADANVDTSADTSMDTHSGSYFGYQLPATLAATVASWIPFSLPGNDDHQTDQTDQQQPAHYASAALNRRHTGTGVQEPGTLETDRANRRKTISYPPNRPLQPPKSKGELRVNDNTDFHVIVDTKLGSAFGF